MIGALVGRKIRVLSAPNPLHAGIWGEVEDETQKMLVIRSDGKARMVPKIGAVFLVEENKAWKKVDGAKIIGKLEDRSKK